MYHCKSKPASNLFVRSVILLIICYTVKKFFTFKHYRNVFKGVYMFLKKKKIGIKLFICFVF